MIARSCGFGECPAVYEFDEYSVIVVGKEITTRDADLIGVKIAPEEAAVIAPRALLMEINKCEEQAENRREQISQE